LYFEDISSYYKILYWNLNKYDLGNLMDKKENVLNEV